MNIAQEVFIDHEPSTITYEVGCHHPISLILIANLIHLLTDESIHLPILGRCAKLIRVQTQCSLAAMLAKSLFSTPWSRFLRTRGYKKQITNHQSSISYFHLFFSWISTHGMCGHRISKAGAKKRRGRPPKFQISEIGEDGRKWYSCRWLLSSLTLSILTLTCSVCEQKYEDRMELMQHMRQHNAVR